MEKIIINHSAFYQIKRQSENAILVSMTIDNKYVSNYLVAKALQDKIKKNYPDFLALQYSLVPELYFLLNKVKNSGFEPFPQVVVLSLKK